MRVNDACALSPGISTFAAPRFDGMLVGAHGVTQALGQNSRVTGGAPAAAPSARHAGITNGLKSFHTGGKFRFDDLDGRSLTVTQMKGRCGDPIYARARTGAAAEDFIMHIGPVAPGVSSPQNQG